MAFPQGWEEPGKILKLTKTVYGLSQAPLAWFNKLSDGLHQDVCIDYYLMFARNEKHIDEAISNMISQGFELRIEDNAAGFLGIDLFRQDNGSIELKQTALIERIIEMLVYRLPHLIQHWLKSRNYSLINLDLVLKRIGTKDTRKGQIGHHRMVINPTDHLTLDYFVDANFSGPWVHEDDQDPSSMKSHTWCVLTLGDMPILWVSKLQKLSQQLELNRELLSTVSTVREDNNGALALANMPVPHMAPCSKHIGVKYHWLCSWINEPSNGIVVQHINSKEQQREILTKLEKNLDMQ
eukprot:14105249-Ditylum_brightwellii.AAC.1